MFKHTNKYLFLPGYFQKQGITPLGRSSPRKIMDSSNVLGFSEAEASFEIVTS